MVGERYLAVSVFFLLLLVGFASAQDAVCADCSSPNDMDNDGLYEDVNGDGSLTTVDVNLLSDKINAESDDVMSDLRFDFNENGEIDVGDSQALTQESYYMEDSDLDGVIDLDDECPDTAGDGSDGCPTESNSSSEVLFDISLHSGWNLVSGPEPFTISEIADDCALNAYEGERAWAYSGGWTHPSTVNPARAVYVYSDGICTATVENTVQQSLETSLSAGWNAVSVQSSVPLGQIVANCNVNEYKGSPLWHYAGGNWDTFTLSDGLDPTKGFFVNVGSACNMDFGAPIP